MNLIKGQTIKLIEKTQTGLDPFGAPIYAENEIDVDNVLISPTSDTDVVTDMQMYGKASTYTLSIPKGDSHDWTDTKVKFFGKTWHTFGNIVEYQEELVPLSWNKKIKVELYE